MKTIELEVMEVTNGGVSCGGGVGAAVGITVGLTILAVATGGVGLAIGAIFSFGGGSILSVGNCRNRNFQ